MAVDWGAFLRGSGSQQVNPNAGTRWTGGSLSRPMGQTRVTPRDTGGLTGLSDLVSQSNISYQQAKAANEARYQQMLGITEETTQQRAADVRSDYGARGAGIQQGLQRSGLGGSTIGATMGLGVEREQQSALDRLADQMQGTKLGIMERREDAYPDTGGLMELIAGLSSGSQESTQDAITALGKLKF